MRFTPFLLTFTLLLSVPNFSYGEQRTEKQNGIYRVAIPEKVSGFDPINSDNSITANIIKHIYGTLVDYRTKKESSNQSFNDIVPQLAEEWNISSDRKIYNFKIRDNVYFHNGRKLTAFDVKHTIERLANPKILPSFFNWIFRDIPIKGLKKYQNDCKKNVSEPDLEGIKVLDDRLVQIILTAPTPLLLKELTLPVFSIIPKEETDKWENDFRFHPVGTGPFMFESFSENKIVFKKNPKYYEKETPHISTLIYKVVTKSEDEYKLFQQNELEQTSIPDSEVDELMQKEQWGKFGTNVFNSTSFNDHSVSEIIKEPLMINTFLGINLKHKGFDSIKVRQALNYSINKSKIITKILNYKAIDSFGPLPEHFPGASENRQKPYPFDPVKEKKLLYETGLSDYSGDGILELKGKPVTLNLWYYQNSEAEKVCNSIKNDLQAVGFKINLKKATDWKDFLKKIISGQAELYHYSWKANYADPDKFLTPLFDSRYIGSTNLTGFSNSEVDRLLARGRVVPEDEFRYRFYKNVEKIIIEQAPWVFLYQPAKYVMIKPYVFGMQVHPILQNVFKYTYIDKSDNSLTLTKK